MLAVAGCGADSDAAGGEAPAALLGERPGKLTCTEWKAGSDDERLGSIEQLTMLAGANANPEDVGPNRTLSDEDAYRAINGTCEHDAARGFLLYEVYNRAAAFDFEGLEDLTGP
jgi:hypothetical protein